MGIDTSFIDWQVGKMGFLHKEDWECMERTIDRFNIKSIVEFGTGITTRLFLAKGLSVFSIEQDKRFIDKLKIDADNLKKDFDFWIWEIWDGKYMDSMDAMGEVYDAVLVDGPWCPEPPGSDPNFVDRDVAWQMTIAANPEIIMVHDIPRPNDQMLMAKHLRNYEMVDEQDLTAVYKRL